MAHAETVARGACACCGGSVAVKLNRSNLAYYRCDDCGAEVRHHWQKTSDKYMRKFAAKVPAVAPEAAPENRSESRAPAAPKKSGGGLSSFFGG